MTRTTYKLTPAETVTVRRSTDEALEVEVVYGAGEPPPPHCHPGQDERFEVLAGTLRARVDGREHTLGPGDVLDIPRGAPHQMWNEGEDQVRAVWETRPAGRTLDWFSDLDALQRRGAVRSDGMPGPLAFGVLLHEYRDVFRLAMGPAPLVRGLVAVLAAAGRLRGYAAGAAAQVALVACLAAVALAVAAPPAPAADSTLVLKLTGPGGAEVGGGCATITPLDGSGRPGDEFCMAGGGTSRILPPGTYRLHETRAPDLAGHYPLKADDVDFTIASGVTKEITLRHEAGAEVQVTPRLPDGAIARACFEAVTPTGRDDACADPAKGAAVLRVPPAAAARIRQTTSPAGHVPASDIVLQTTAGVRYDRTVDLRVATGGLDVVQLSEAGERLGGGCWSMYELVDGDERHRANACDDDEDGIASFRRVVPGRYRVLAVQAPAGHLRAGDVLVTIGDAVERAERTHRALGTIRTRTTTADGAALPGSCWYVVEPGQSEGWLLRLCDADDGSDDGSTAIEGLEQGDYELVHASAPSPYERLRTREPFTVGADDVTLDHVLRRAGDPDPDPDPDPVPPANTVAPAISGPLALGARLTGTAGEWTGEPATIDYAWERCDADGGGCVAIPGATESTYTLTRSDAGARLRLAVTAGNDGGATRAVSEPTAVLRIPAPENVAAPQISVLLNALAVATPGRWQSAGGPLTYRYQWLRCDTRGASCTELDGQTRPLVAVDRTAAPYRLRMRVTATDPQGGTTVVSAASRLVGRAIPVLAADDPPSLTPSGDTAPVGTLLRSDAGTWDVSTGPVRLRYGWRVCDRAMVNCAMSSVTGKLYRLTRRDEGRRVQAVITAEGQGGTASAVSPSVLAGG